MKLYQSEFSPNSRRVRMYLAEKRVQVPCVQVDIRKGATHTPEYLKINPMGEVPVLELDNGRRIAESIAICRYFEALYPEPSLFGATPDQIGTIEMWQRRIELKWFGPLISYWHHTSPMWTTGVKQIPEWAEQTRVAINKFLTWLDSDMSEREFIAGASFSIADILGLAAMDHGNLIVGFMTPPELRNIARWHATVSSRASAKA